MIILPSTDSIHEYIKEDDVIDYSNEIITQPVLIYHGLNGVYIKEYKKWIRLDARGNKEGVNAQFSIEIEQLAFPIRPEKGEMDSFIVYPDPDIKVLEKLRNCKTRTELWDSLPTELHQLR